MPPDAAYFVSPASNALGRPAPQLVQCFEDSDEYFGYYLPSIPASSGDAGPGRCRVVSRHDQTDPRSKVRGLSGKLRDAIGKKIGAKPIL